MKEPAEVFWIKMMSFLGLVGIFLLITALFTECSTPALARTYAPRFLRIDYFNKDGNHLGGDTKEVPFRMTIAPTVICEWSGAPQSISVVCRQGDKVVYTNLGSCRHLDMDRISIYAKDKVGGESKVVGHVLWYCILEKEA